MTSSLVLIQPSKNRPFNVNIKCIKKYHGSFWPGYYFVNSKKAIPAQVIPHEYLLQGLKPYLVLRLIVSLCYGFIYLLWQLTLEYWGEITYCIVLTIIWCWSDTVSDIFKGIFQRWMLPTNQHLALLCKECGRTSLTVTWHFREGEKDQPLSSSSVCG